MKFNYLPTERWPRLSWLVRLREGSDVLDVWHGNGIETHDQWFCEAAWAGPFEAGGFDETDIVCGSGVRLRDQAVTFVSSGSTTDRLHMVRRGSEIWISNSLACVLARTGLAPKPTFGSYQRLLYSVVRGIDRYERFLPMEGGEVELVYFDNLHWDGHQLRRVEKPLGDRGFQRFDDYVAFLRHCLAHIAQNMTHPTRTTRYRFLGTLSTGYDSSTITSLAREFGLQEVICFTKPSGRDTGTDLAKYLGVNAVEVDVDAWRQNGTSEVPFIAADVFGEDVQYGGARHKLESRVLLTGYHGDKVWDRNTPYLSPTYVRGDPSGLALSEYRLDVGFLNCPVPFWGARRIADINRISRSQELSPWDVGGDYTRPICRRIVEEAGAPRRVFGQQKSFAAQWLSMGEAPLTEASIADLQRYLAEHKQSFLKRGKIPPGVSEFLDTGLMDLAYRLSGSLVRAPGLFRTGAYQWPIIGGLVNLRIPNAPCPPFVAGVRRYLFQWALSRMMIRYGSAL